MSDKHSNNQPRVVIVGAAMLLGALGVDVTMLEARDRVGGRTSTIEQDGYRFDLGPTFFLYPEALRSLFRMCGRSQHQAAAEGP